MRIALLFLALVAIAAVVISRRKPARRGDDTGSGDRGTSAPSPPRETPPARLELAGQEPFDMAAHLMDGHSFGDKGIPILDFEALDAWAAKAGSKDSASAAAQAGRRAWLLHVRDRLGPTAELTEIEGAWVLSTWSPRVARAAAKYIGVMRARIGTLLEGLAEFPAGERSTLIVFDTQEDYYHYVANYYPEDGEFAFSGGMFLNTGFQHFVAVLNDLGAVEPVIAHEMTHYGLAHLALPLWLDEGVAVNTEHLLAVNYRHPRSTVELIEKHHRFWTPTTIQQFWSGQSFHRADEGNELSYDLARAIVDLLGRDWASFARFAKAAQREDGGAAAARAELKLDLGGLAAAAINVRPDPEWSPRPQSWEGVSSKARLTD
jgi:hypothetical protein